LGTAQPAVPVVWANVQPDLPIAPTVAIDTAGALADISTCTARYRGAVPDDVNRFYSYLYEWLKRGGQVSSEPYTFDPFRGVAPEHIRSWIRANDARIASCTVDLTAMPR
jgi:hypothetical protein